MPESKRSAAAFTLVELLTVIAIIAVLTSLLLAVIPALTKAAKIRKAGIQMNDLATGIQGYESAYGHFPVSRAAQAAANPDFTYGGVFQNHSGSVTIGTLVTNSIVLNAEIVAVLMNFTNYPGTAVPTPDANFQANPQRTPFLNANLSGDTVSPGVGTDLVYRDPWGHPYVISLDLNDDDLCEDALYRLPAVSTGGINGLILQADGNYAFHGRIMVWSAGPDGMVDTTLPADQGVNNDNILTWH